MRLVGMIRDPEKQVYRIANMSNSSGRRSRPKKETPSSEVALRIVYRRPEHGEEGIEVHAWTLFHGIK
jgi:hypothetical protein